MRNPDNEFPRAEEARIIEARIQELERQQAEDKKRDEEYKQRQLRFNKLLVVFTAGLFLTSVCANLIMFCQVRAGELSAGAATSAARTAQKTLEAMKTGGEETRTQVERLIAQQQRTADAMEKSLQQSREAIDRSERQSKAALDASIAAIRLDQRAWVTATRFVLSEEPIRGQLVKVSFFIMNSGKTPAVEILDVGEVVISATPPVLHFPPAYATIGSDISGGSRAVLPPGVTNLAFNAYGGTFTPGMLAMYVQRSALLYVQARIYYRDIFGRSHWTDLCAHHRYGTDLDMFGMCHDGNAVDAEK